MQSNLPAALAGPGPPWLRRGFLPYIQYGGEPAPCPDEPFRAEDSCQIGLYRPGLNGWCNVRDWILSTAARGRMRTIPWNIPPAGLRGLWPSHRNNAKHGLSALPHPFRTTAPNHYKIPNIKSFTQFFSKNCRGPGGGAPGRPPQRAKYPLAAASEIPPCRHFSTSVPWPENRGCREAPRPGSSRGLRRRRRRGASGRPPGRG